MPLGLASASVAFQLLMAECLVGLGHFADVRFVDKDTHSFQQSIFIFWLMSLNVHFRSGVFCSVQLI